MKYAWLERLLWAARRCRPVCRVLLVQGERAWWSRWQAGHCLDWASTNLADGVPAFADLADRHGLRVVIDDAAADIERLASGGFGTGPLGRWQRFQFARRRLREDTGTTIGWLGRHASSNARAALHHDAPPAMPPARIDALLDEHDAVSCVTTSERLLASSRARRAPPCLMVQRHDGVERHLLVVDGVACFARRVALDTDDADAAINASLDHALERWGLEPVQLRLEGGVCYSEEQIAAIEALPGVAGVTGRQAAAGACDDALRHLASLAASGRRCGRTALRWHPLLRRVRARRERLHLNGIVALTLLVSFGAAAQAITVGREHARQAGLLGLQRDSVIAELERLDVEAATIHAEPDRAARYIERFDRLNAAAPPSPGNTLGAVAVAFARHPAIVLDSLAWTRTAVPIDRGESASFLLADASAIPTHGSGMVLELAGRTDPSSALRDAQRQSVALTGELDRQSRLSGCHLIDSPLARAAEGRPAGEPDKRAATTVDRDASGEVDWRIRCTLSSGGRGVPG